MLKIYDSFARQKREFIPLVNNTVTMYVCGMTVYDLCHLGHARTQVAFDVIYRYLQYKGYAVTYVRNITDIDDKIIQRAHERGIGIDALTHENIAAMHADLSGLFLQNPTHEPTATDNINHMIAMIAELLAKQNAYIGTNGDVFYAVTSFSDYGKLSGQNLENLQVGARVVENEAKNNFLDFVLWKLAKPGEPAWDSPWGRGRPGWHIECSAMVRNTLGERIDIHGGGADLKFPHHENEIAQTTVLTQQPMANFWLHAGFLNIKDEKMSKSLNNFISIREALKLYNHEVLRMFFVASHYRSEINYSDESLSKTKESLDTLYLALRMGPRLRGDDGWGHGNDEKFVRRFEESMDDDFNTPEAFAVLFDLAHEINKNKSPILAHTLYKLAGILGLLQSSPEEYFQQNTNTADLAAAEVDDLIRQRLQARAAKNWKLADEIRDKLTAHKIILEDDASGTKWRRGV